MRQKSWQTFGSPARLFVVLIFLTSVGSVVQAQSPHDPDISGVQIGMDVPSALGTIGRQPDAKRSEGKDKKDIRVLYKETAGGPLQIVFADGKWVKEIQIEYPRPLSVGDLRLLESSSTFSNSGGETRRDDRYSVGFTSDEKRERYWWRDEKTPAGYRIRVGFVSANTTRGGLAAREIVRKIITIVPEDKDKFAEAMASRQVTP